MSAYFQSQAASMKQFHNGTSISSTSRLKKAEAFAYYKLIYSAQFIVVGAVAR